MRTKKDILEQISADPLYASVTRSVSQDEKQIIDSTVESMIVDVVLQMDEFAEKIKQNPDAMSELARGLSGTSQIVNNETTAPESTKLNATKTIWSS